MPCLFSFYAPKKVPFSSLRIKGELGAAARGGNWQRVQPLCSLLEHFVVFDARDGAMRLTLTDRMWVLAMLAVRAPPARAPHPRAASRQSCGGGGGAHDS